MTDEKPFPWGQELKRFNYDFDVSIMKIIKFHPWKVKNGNVMIGSINTTEILYSCEEIHRSTYSLFELILYYIAVKQLGANNDSLVVGISKALNCN